MYGALDVTFREDLCRVRTDYAGQNLDTLRENAFNVLRQDTTKKIGLQAKRHRAAWETRHLELLLTRHEMRLPWTGLSQHAGRQHRNLRHPRGAGILSLRLARSQGTQGKTTKRKGDQTLFSVESPYGIKITTIWLALDVMARIVWLDVPVRKRPRLW